MSGSRPDDDESNLDPVFVSSMRESKWILVIWLANFVWVVGFSYLAGYEGDGQQPIATTLGMPRWVFWGVFFPWILTVVLTSWFALTQMADHPLDDDVPRDQSGGSGDPG